jgi:hypothetical protein
MDIPSALRPGMSIRVIREFNDFDGKLWPVDFVFKNLQRYNCVPYHGGHTFSFENAALRLCDNVPENGMVLFKSEDFFSIEPD